MASELFFRENGTIVPGDSNGFSLEDLYGADLLEDDSMFQGRPLKDGYVLIDNLPDLREEYVIEEGDYEEDVDFDSLGKPDQVEDQFVTYYAKYEDFKEKTSEEYEARKAAAEARLVAEEGVWGEEDEDLYWCDKEWEFPDLFDRVDEDPVDDLHEKQFLVITDILRRRRDVKIHSGTCDPTRNWRGPQWARHGVETIQLRGLDWLSSSDEEATDHAMADFFEGATEEDVDEEEIEREEMIFLFSDDFYPSKDLIPLFPPDLQDQYVDPEPVGDWGWGEWEEFDVDPDEAWDRWQDPEILPEEWAMLREEREEEAEFRDFIQRVWPQYAASFNETDGEEIEPESSLVVRGKLKDQDDLHEEQSLVIADILMVRKRARSFHTGEIDNKRLYKGRQRFRHAPALVRPESIRYLSAIS
ncbi:MAG TPA: hypothetical protein VJB99_03570 [Patescibacteria group bacterium]|nr:hypothetical protein [Patescibacteria group bacterium]